MASVFISYRRGDTDIAAGRLADDLAAIFGRAMIFRDIDTLEAGEDYVTALEHALDSCAVLLAVIGPRWTGAIGENSASRLAEPNDWVRLEISHALKRGIRVIPVLVSADMPKETEVPEDLKPLLRRQAFEVMDRHWRSDVELLADVIKRSPGIATQPVAPPGSAQDAGHRRKSRRILLACAAALALAALIAVVWSQLRKPAAYVAAKAFTISSSQDQSTARRLTQDLETHNLSLANDYLNQQKDEPLSPPIQNAIEKSRYVIVLWSKAASESLYVRAELLASYQLKKLVVPCLLDNTSIPVFLRGLPQCDLRRQSEPAQYAKAVSRILDSLGRAAPMSPVAISHSPSGERDALFSTIASTQNAILGLFQASKLAAASRLQSKLDPVITRALKNWPDDPDILSGAGYQAKNDYLLKYWGEIKAGKMPPSDELKTAAIFFYRSLDSEPDNPSALNGLGSVLMMRRDLNAAEFFVRRAIEKMKAEGQSYPDAEEDLKQILRLKSDNEQPWNR
jgi:TIR domain